MNPMLLDFLLAIARWALTAAGSALVAHHILTASQDDSFLTAIFAHLALWIPLAGSFVLLLWTRYRARLKFMTALTMPVGSTEAQVTAKMASGVPIPTVTTPTNTVPGVPK